MVIFTPELEKLINDGQQEVDAVKRKTMTAQAIAICPFGFGLVIPGNPLGMTGVALGAVNFRVDPGLI
jgi:hypothetical protein